ncbi:MAG: hypothetical protein DME91_08700 [Verrucomicrobia bacterium]|nr:MAG: hypothetical protein DME91_08700 [Verrucomicrobiota bacterium]PYK64997.1 MAG: hypothetical protein DME50_10620 [Verrucomicrobiota bacterium]
MQPPEKRARANIDAMLQQCGWIVQDYKQVDLSAGRGVAVCEVPLKKGRCDYLLLVDRKPVGIVEAKKEGYTLSSVADQSGRYAKNLPDFLRGNVTGTLPFLYESTGIETFFRDERDPHPRSRQLFALHRPETLAKWIEEPDTLRRRLTEMAFKYPYDGRGVRVCRVEAITGLEKSFAEAKPRALIQMATGAGNCTNIWRATSQQPISNACSGRSQSGHANRSCVTGERSLTSGRNGDSFLEDPTQSTPCILSRPPGKKSRLSTTST